MNGAPRYSVTMHGFDLAAGDQLGVTTNDPAGDSLGYTLVQRGGWGTLDDGNIEFYGEPSSHGTARIRNRHSELTVRLLTNATGLTHDDTQTGSEPFQTHVRDGARVTFSGRAFAGFRPYTFLLSYRLAFQDGGAGIITGTTYPHAQVLAYHSATSVAMTYRTVANAEGKFRIVVADVRRGDMVDVAAIEPDGSGNWISSTTVAGAMHPEIHGPHDRAVVRRTAHYAVRGTDGGATWTLFTPGGASMSYHGRNLSLHTRRLAPGVYRLQVVATGWSMVDYRYLVVRH
jgi:hypothetical protein